LICGGVRDVRVDTWAVTTTHEFLLRVASGALSKAVDAGVITRSELDQWFAEQAGARLPPLLLVVLYNGAGEWSAPIETRELITLPEHSPLWPWQPQVRYYLLNMRTFPEEDLARRTSLAALLFRLEKRHSRKELAALFREVVAWFREHEGYERLRMLFNELVREAFAGAGAEVPQDEDMMQMMTTNLSRMGAYWKRKWKTVGRAEGHAQGRTEGKAEGKAEALVDLLRERFGAVTPSVCKKIFGAKPAAVERWFKRAVAAPDVTSVFGRSRSEKRRRDNQCPAAGGGA